MCLQAGHHRSGQSLLLPPAGGAVPGRGALLHAEASAAGAPDYRPRLPPAVLRGDERSGGTRLPARLFREKRRGLVYLTYIICLASV